jgi:hypothetical protein
MGLVIRNAVGTAAGLLLAPITGTISAIRRARMFHPDGVVYEASVMPVQEPADLSRAGKRLQGRAIVRLSSAWWKGDKEWIDALGLAVRFDHDQDLLFATIRFPWTTPLAPLTTHVHSFLWNHYHAVSPFDVAGLGRVKLRLRSPRIANLDENVPRSMHLAQMAEAGHAAWILQARRMDLPLLHRFWEPIARVVLERPIDVDQAALRFSPFNDGAGYRPVGFVHKLRVATYAASQGARPRYA